MTNLEVSPALVIRQYVWAVLHATYPDVWNSAKYGGLLPIVPLNEEPELDEFDGPRIVYEYTHTDAGSTYFRGQANMTFAVRDHNYRRMGKTLNILEQALSRQDETARDINDFVDRRKAGGIDYDISFGFIKCEFVQSGTPETEEGGRSVGIINISFDFFVEYESVNTRPPV